MILPSHGTPVRIIRSGHTGVRGFATVMRKEVTFESSPRPTRPPRGASRPWRPYGGWSPPGACRPTSDNH